MVLIHRYTFFFITIFMVIINDYYFFVHAQFGMKKKNVKNNNDNSNNDNNNNNPILSQGQQQNDILNFNDAELQEAIQMFADMPTSQMMETINELKEDLKDDPDLIAELDDILHELSLLDEEEIQSNLEGILQEELVANSMLDTLDLLRNADDASWEKILANKDLILESVIQSGIMDDEEIELFKNDAGAWEDELKYIWSELKSQSSTGTDEL